MSGNPASPASRLKVVIGALAAGLLIPLATWLLSVSVSSTVLAAVGFACACAGGLLAGFTAASARTLRGQADKMSGDIDAVSRRLVRIETGLADLRTQRPPDSTAAVEEITAEIALLGGLVRDVAVTMASHDRDLVTLKAGLSVEARSPQASLRPPLPGLLAGLASTEAEALPRPLPAPVQPAPVQPAPLEAMGSLTASAAPVSRADHAPADSISERGKGPDESADAILAAFRASGAVELYLQAIVSLPQRKLKIYEAQPRLRLPGREALLAPAEFVPALERLGVVPDLDRMVLARSAVIARHLASRGSDALIACALSPAGVALPGFLRAVNRLVETHPELSGRLILGLSQRCWRTLDAERAGALAAMRENGFSFMLDRASDLRLDPVALADRGVRFAKVSAKVLLQPGSSGGEGDIAVGDLAAVLARLGVALIADGVEREQDVPDLIELDTPLAQGGVFAPPRAVRGDALSPSAPAESAPPSAPSEPDCRSDATLERRPFRDFLRRAG